MTNTKIITSAGIIFLLGVIIFSYADVLQWMLNRYLSPDSYYSHGFLVPFVSLYLIWQDRDRLRELKINSSWLGLILICCSLLLHLAGTIIYIYSVSSFSLFFLIIGLTLFLFGPQITKAIAFPLLFLVFMFPLPMAVISMVSFPLKMFAAKAGVWLVSLFGIPVLREGFNISIPSGNLIVGNPCSGLRSLISFLALGAIYAYLTSLPFARKWVLFIISVPIALLANILRVSILILASHYWGLAAAAPDTILHTGTGLAMFVLGVLLLLVCSKVLE